MNRGKITESASMGAAFHPPRSGLVQRIGFNLNASRSYWVTAVAVGRIQDKTRWTKALGEPVTLVYGECKEKIGQSRRTSTVGHENTGQSLTQRIDCDL